MTLGFTVGKFYPPHLGHHHLISTARRQVDQMIVMLCHHESQKIPGELRRQWLQEMHPDCDIRVVPDTLANESEAWAAFTFQSLGRAPDIVFSSEEYGPRFAALMNARHVMVDLDRSAVPICATQVRSAPLDHLEYLAPCVRAHFVRRVVLIGAESTGKTTLAAAVAERFATSWVPEYGREYWERRVAGLSMDGPLPPWRSDEFQQIAQQQQECEQAAARTANRVLFCDTNAFATGTWHERYMHHRSEAVDAIGRRDKVDLYLLTEPDFPFVQDGWRDGESIRDWMHARFVEQLNANLAPVIRLGGSQDERLATATAAVNDLLMRPFDL